MEYPANFRFDTDALYDAYASREYWEHRVAAVGGEGAQLVRHEVSDTGIQVTLTQILPRTELPPVAQKFIKEDLTVNREIEYGPRQRTTTGTFKATVSIGMGQLTGSYEWYPSAGGCTLKTVTEATVSIPFVGKQLENLILSNLRELYEQEILTTADWVAQHQK